MVMSLWGGAVIGCEPVRVDIEVDLADGLPGMAIVGLPDASVNEARERVRAAVRNAGFDLPARRVTVNLAPADLRKEGAGLDLPIAVGLLGCAGVFPANAAAGMLFAGELALDGSLRHARGLLPMALLARRLGARAIVVPAANACEAAVVPGLAVHPFDRLEAVIASLAGQAPWPSIEAGSGTRAGDDATAIGSSPDRSPHVPPAGKPLSRPGAAWGPDLADIRGQETARRALTVAAAGDHNLLLVGSPGAGKTMLARALPGLLPPLTFEESLEVTQIYSVRGLLPPGHGLITGRPFRDPHHTASDVALIGGGQNPQPGEVSLAHHGILFLDELPEFRPRVLDVLREPMSEGRVSIARAAAQAIFPARFRLVAAMNPCPCGFLGDEVRGCTCSPRQVRSYQHRVSGPLLDRIDLQIPVRRLPASELDVATSGPTSEEVARQILSARQRRQERADNAARRGPRTPAAEIRALVATLAEGARTLLQTATRHFALSARAHHSVLRVARTIADLAGNEGIGVDAVAEAIQYRTQDLFAARP